MALLIFMVTLLGCLQLWAAGLATPFSITTTQVLPKGVRSLSYGGMTTMVDGWYNDTGVSTGVAEPFNQQLSYSRLLKAESDTNLVLNVESQLANKGVSLDNIAGTSTADINTRVVMSVPVLAYGITDRLTMAVAVPIMYSKVDVETGFVGTDELQKLVNDFSQKSRKQTQLIESKLTDVIATELSNKGYKPLEDEESTEVGDVTMVAKYLASQGLHHSWAISTSLTLPTGHVRDVNKVVDPTPGDGQVDLGVTSTLQIPVTSKFNFINSTGYLLQFADTRETRLPISEDERLSKDIDYGARRDLGDQMFSSFAALYSPWSLLTLGASYTVAYKERDRWSGSQGTADRYRALGVETEQFMQAMYLQTTLSTISAYRRKSFPVPFSATLGMGQAIAGRNVRNDPLWSMNVSLFF